jgi:hypothetical protein
MTSLIWIPSGVTSSLFKLVPSLKATHYMLVAIIKNDNFSIPYNLENVVVVSVWRLHFTHLVTPPHHPSTTYLPALTITFIVRE